ncbi:Acetyltransferase [compost metagenome]
MLDTATGEPAEAIYERLGWERVGVIPDYALFPDGRYCSTTLFFKRIHPSL